MPTYEYNCDKCGHFEIWQSIKDDALKACPTCGSNVQRLISANVGFVFKGAGFYQNDYKTGGSSNPSTKSSGSAPVSSAPKSDSTPSTDAGQGCGTCGSPDPCPSGNN